MVVIYGCRNCLLFTCAANFVVFFYFHSSKHKFSKHNLTLEKVADTETVEVEVKDDK